MQVDTIKLSIAVIFKILRQGRNGGGGPFLLSVKTHVLTSRSIWII